MPLLKKNRKPSDSNTRIEKVRSKVEGAFDKFRKLSEQLEGANAELSEIVQEESRHRDREAERIATLLADHEAKELDSKDREKRAELEMHRNSRIKSKVDEFIK